MSADLATCEWSPGSNRAVVNPVAAVARLQMPAAVRAVLVEKMKRHAFDDQVTVTAHAITSDAGANSYDATISNMNFAAGRICRKVTRNGWNANHREGAIVYIVGDRAFGVAATCGNLFQIVALGRNDDKPAAETPQPGNRDSAPPDRGTPAEATAGVATDAPVIEASDEPSGTWKQWPELPSPPLWVQAGNPVPVAPVPEPSTWLTLAAGLLLVAFKGAKQ